MARLKADTAAIVAANLTLARATLLSGMLAGRASGAGVEMEDDIMEKLYVRYLAFASEVDPRNVDAGAVLDLSQSSILSE